jgi:hypothetical protein
MEVAARQEVGPAAGVEMGGSAWVAGRSLAYAGTLLLTPDQKEFTLLYDDITLVVSFTDMGEDNKRSVIQAETPHHGKLKLPDIEISAGASWFWEAVGQTNDGRPIGLSLYVQTVGTDQTNSARLVG